MRKLFGILLALALALSFSLVATTPVEASDPPYAGGLALHLDASDATSVTKDGANRVSEWRDLSTQGNHASQLTAANQPLWVDDELAGKPVIRFDGNSDWMSVLSDESLSITDNRQYTILVVFSTITGARGQLVGKRVNPGDWRPHYLAELNYSDDLRASVSDSGGNAAEALASAAVFDGEPHIFASMWDEDDFVLYLDGATMATEDASAVQAFDSHGAGVPLSIGAHYNGIALTGFLNGDIAEILIYDRALSDTEREQVEQYLGVKWLSTCLATATGTGTACFYSSQGTIEDLKAVPAVSPAPRGVSFPHGMFEFRVTGLISGQTITVVIELPQPVPDGFVWWKHDGTRWYSLPNLRDNGDNIMVIELTDGGLGDTDGIADGVITDPGGPGNPVPPLTVGWEGSAVNKAAVMAPWIALLTVMMAGALLVVRRRRAQI